MIGTFLGSLFRGIRNALSIPGDSLAQPSGWLSRLFALAQTSSGVVINEHNALAVADVYKCVRVIGETFAMLPWKMYRRRPDGREEAREHPLFVILHDEPNPHMTSFTFREYMATCMLLWGKFFGYIERDNLGRVSAIWPIRPDRCRLEVIDGVMWFHAQTTTGQQLKFWDDEILYIPMLTKDGYHAYSPIELHRETLGLSKATEIFGAKFFGNGAHPGGFLEAPTGISDAAMARLKASFQQKQGGLENAGRIAVLEEGMSFKPSTIPPDDAQFLQTRQFQRGEVAGIFRTPPHKIGDLSRSTNNNIEHQALEFLTDTIAPLLERIEQACNRRLLLPSEKKRYYNEFDIEGMLRGDTAARVAYAQGMFNIGVLSDNEIRRTINLPPVLGGDQRFVPMNMVPLHQAGKVNDDGELDPNGQPIARVQRANLRFFRDAVGRILNRKPEDRARYTPTAFSAPLWCLFECILGEVKAEADPNQPLFDELLASLAANTANWGNDTSDNIAQDLLAACTDTILKRGKK